MKTQTIDKKLIKVALLELIQSDKNFVLQMLETFMVELTDYQQTMFANEMAYIVPSTTRLTLYQQTLSAERLQKQLSIKSKNKQKKGIDPKVIEALQAEFRDAPPVEEMIKLLHK